MIFDRRQLRTIAALSLPAVVTNITTPLLALTDVAIVGHMGSAVYIAAIAVGGTMFNMLYWLFGFLRMGSSGLAAQAYGAGNRHVAQVVLNRALLLALVIGVIFMLFQMPLADGLLRLLDVDGETGAVARSYFHICIWGAPATLGMFALTGWCVGMQNSRLPMCMSLFIDIINIAISLLLVYVADLKIEGVAIGTLSAQWAGFMFAVCLVVRRYGWHRVVLKEMAVGFGRFFKINTDIFLRTICLVAVTMWFTCAGAEQGALMLAVNALLMQLFTLFSYFMDGLAFAAEALCGRYLGARDYRMLSSSVRSVLSVGAVLAFIFTLLYIFGGDAMLRLLSSDAEVVSAAGEYAVWAICVPFVAFAAFMWDGVFIGLTRTRMMLLSMVLATAVYFLTYFAVRASLCNHGLWIAFLAYLLTRGVVLFIAGRHYLSPYSSR